MFSIAETAETCFLTGCQMIKGRGRMRSIQRSAYHRRYRVRGCALQAARKRQEWTQEQVVRKLDEHHVFIEVRTYRRWEQGRSSMTHEQAQVLCTIFQRTAQELGLLEASAEDASTERSFALEIESPPSSTCVHALSATEGQNGVKGTSHVRTPSSPSALVAAGLPQSDEMVTFAQILQPPSSVLRIAVLHISREDLIDVLRQRRDEQPSSLPSIAFPNGGSTHQDLILAILWPVDQNTST